MKISALALILFIYFTAFTAASQVNEPFFRSDIHKIRLHVLSFNIKGLPSAILSSQYKDRRYSLIGRLIAGRKADKDGPEVVLLQEAFSTESRMLETAAGFPYRTEGPGARSLLGVNSGLVILSRYPIKDQASRAFGDGKCGGWDCLSNKGVQFARISLPGFPRPVEIFNTHLQAGREDTHVRRSQVKVLVEFFKEHHRPGNPVIFAGDFNFRPGMMQQSYLDFAKETGFAHAGKFCLERGCAKTPDVGWHGIWERAVDHQFFSDKGEVRIIPTEVKRSYQENVEGLKLSDHPAHEVSYELVLEPRISGRQIAQEDPDPIH